MAVRTHDDFDKYIENAIKFVIDSTARRTKTLLLQHINTDTYGIGKNNFGNPIINDYYLDGSGRPSYEFRDKAWDLKLEKYLFSIIYNGDNMTPPSSQHPTLHGNYESSTGKMIDRRELLADILNISGNSGGKDREPFWDNFEQELNEKIGNWLYTDFKKKGLDIPSLKGTKFK